MSFLRTTTVVKVSTNLYANDAFIGSNCSLLAIGSNGSLHYIKLHFFGSIENFLPICFEKKVQDHDSYNNVTSVYLCEYTIGCTCSTLKR